MLPPELEAQARGVTESHNEVYGDPFRDYLSSWLDVPLPADWDTYEPKRRRDYYLHYDPLEAIGAVRRTEIALCEIVTCCPYPGVSRYSPQRFGALLKSLGWERLEGQKRVVGYRGSDGKNIKATVYKKVTTLDGASGKGGYIDENDTV